MLHEGNRQAPVPAVDSLGFKQTSAPPYGILLKCFANKPKKDPNVGKRRKVYTAISTADAIGDADVLDDVSKV